MLPKLWQVVLCITVSILIDEGYGLMCLRCDSTNVNGHCKIGGRSRLSRKRYQTCYGRKPRCYIKATVDENGSARFKRGCTLKKICAENNGLDVEYCSTCSNKYCNYHSMVLDQEVEEYLKDMKASKNNTATSTKPTTKQAESTPETKILPETVTEILPETVTESLPKTVPETIPKTLSKPVSETVSNSVQETVTVSVPESIPTNVTEK